MEHRPQSVPNPLPPPFILQTAIGNNNVQVLLQNVHGSPVNIDARPRVRPRLRPLPARYAPPPFPGLLDREPEQRTLIGALRAHEPVNIHGGGGLGKTVLLRALAHHPALDTSPFPAGVLYLSARAQPLMTVEDVLEALYELFFDYPSDYKPTRGAIRSGLRDKQALILLDDLPLAREEVDTLLNAASSCTFLMATAERRLWGQGRNLALQGLPPKAALALMERELGRPLEPSEQRVARKLCNTLRGHPLHLLQMAAEARETGRSLTEMADPARAPIASHWVDALSEAERRVLAALALVGGGPLDPEQLAALTGLSQPHSALESLRRRGFVQSHSPRYSLTGDWTKTLRQRWNLAPHLAPALAHLTSWAEARADEPHSILESADALVALLAQAVEAQRWSDVLRLGHTVEVAFAAGRRWGLWACVLHWILEAARALNDRPAEGWALHQLGTRALCLNEPDVARAWLTQSLRLREALGDREGTAVTRHNLSFLDNAPPPPRQAQPSGRIPPLLGVLVALLMIGLLIVAGIIAGGQFRPHPIPTASLPRGPEIPVLSIELEGGCNRTYAPLQESEFHYRTDTGGWVTIRLDNEVVIRAREVAANRIYHEPLRLPRAAGDHLLTFSLDTGARMGFAECPFVIGQTPASGPRVLFDFVAAAPQATWRSNAGALVFGAPDDRGFVLWEDAVSLEDGRRRERVLITQPDWDSKGYVMGSYNETAEIPLQTGDQFIAWLGFVEGAETGAVEVQLRFSSHCDFSEFFVTVGGIRKVYDGRPGELSLPLEQLAGQRGCFTLWVSAAGMPDGDQLAWIEARLERP